MTEEEPLEGAYVKNLEQGEQRLRDEIEHAVERLGEQESEVQAFGEFVEKRCAQLVDQMVELRQRLGAML